MPLPYVSNYIDWLSALKIGDEVGVINYSYSTNYKISTVTGITPKTRQITVKCCGNLKFKGGTYKYKVGGEFCASHAELVPITEEIREKVFRQKACVKLKTTEYEKLSTEKLKTLVEILSVGTEQEIKK